MSEGWEVRKIGDLCNLMTGGTPSRSRKEYFEGGDIKWIVSGDIHQRELQDCKGRITQLGLENSNARFLPVNSVMIALNGQGKTRGTVALLRTKATCNQSLVSMYPKDLKQLLPEYLYINLHGRYEEIRKITGDSGNERRGLNMSLIREIEIPVPPLEEQKKIIAILDEAFEDIDKAIANAECNLTNAQELFDSQLQSVFDSQDGVECQLSDVCSIESKLVDPKQTEFSSLLHVGGGNMVTKSDELVDLKTAQEEGLISGKFPFDADTILYSKIRPYLMKVSRPDFIGLCSADVYPLKPQKSLLDRNYLFFLLLSRDFTNYAIEGSNRAGMPKVNRNHLFSYRFVLPDLNTQTAAVERVNSTLEARDKLSSCYKSKLDCLYELKQSLLHKAFSGELTAENARNNVVAAIAEQDSTLLPEFSADVLAFAYSKHRSAQRDRTFGRVKGQKVLHLVEAVAGVDLGRKPIKDAAGPNDSAHMRDAEDWAAQQSYFTFEARDSGGYEFKRGQHYEEVLAGAYARLASNKDAIARVVDLIIPMDSQEAEVLATVHAAWNNLIIDGNEPTRDAIVAEARENWTASKLNIPEAKFDQAIRFVRQNNIVPDGTAKPVHKQQELLL